MTTAYINQSVLLSPHKPKSYQSMSYNFGTQGNFDYQNLLPTLLPSPAQSETFTPAFGSNDLTHFSFDPNSFTGLQHNSTDLPATYDSGFGLGVAQSSFAPQPTYASSSAFATPSISRAPAAPVYTPKLTIEQHPKKGGVPKKPRHNSSNGERCEERKPLDPPPVVKIELDANDPDRAWKKFSPYSFVKVVLIKESKSATTGASYEEVVSNGLSGQTAYSVWSDTKHRQEYFILSDLTVRFQGTHKLRIMLYDMTYNPVTCQDEISLLKSVDTENFDVVAFGKFKPDSPTTMTDHLSEQGAKVKKARQKGNSKGLKRDFDQVEQ